MLQEHVIDGKRTLVCRLGLRQGKRRKSIRSMIENNLFYCLYLSFTNKQPMPSEMTGRPKTRSIYLRPRIRFAYAAGIYSVD